MGKFENMYAEDVNFTELNLEIARFNRLLQCNPVVLHLKMTPQRCTCCSGQANIAYVKLLKFMYES